MKKIFVLTGLLLMAAAISTRAQQVSQWVAYNDHYRGANTASNVSSWNILGTTGGAPGNSGPMTNFATGAVLPVTMSLTNVTNGVAGGTTAFGPQTGSPASIMFTNIIDWGSGTLGHALQLQNTGKIAHAFTGLDPSRRYNWFGTAVRGGNYQARWTLLEISAASFVNAHTVNTGTGVFTTVEMPTLAANQAVANFAENRLLGVLAGWTNIAPNPDGSIVIYQASYRGTGLPAGFTTTANADYGYAVVADRLEEFTVTGGVVTNVTVSAPANGATFSLGASINVSASATLGNPITNVAFFHDGVLIGNDTTAPYSVVYSNATLGTHTLTATAKDNTGATTSSTNVVQITVNPNTPPTVNITSPINGSNYLVGVTVTNVAATAADADGVARVDFYLDGVLFFSDTTSPYGFDLCDITAGAHNLSAVAVDALGVSATNSISLVATNPPGIAVIVPNGSTWKYLDNGTDQGTAWRAPAFDDSSWSNGVAELGYGDAPGRPERTTVGFGGVAATKYPTTYFRKSFNVASPGAFTGLSLSVLADDHFIVYLNGNEVFRDMTNTTVTYLTLEAPAIPHDGTVYTNIALATSALVAGANEVAVEIHQDAANSSDISFDLMLWGLGGSSGPVISRSLSGNNLTLTWPGGGTLQRSSDIGSPANWVSIPGAASPFVTNKTGAPKFFRVTVP